MQILGQEIENMTQKKSETQITGKAEITERSERMENDSKKILRAKQVTMAGIKLSQICFGTEHITQASPEFGGALLAEAKRIHGVNFWDTDNSYGSVAQVSLGFKMVRRDEVVISSKSYAETADETRRDIKRTLAELGTDYIDMFLLHEVKAGNLKSLMPSLEVLKEAKSAGIIRGVGLSTHSVQILGDAAETDGIEFVCAPLNIEGSRIEEGTRDGMIKAMDKAHNKCGKGVYVIKTLGAGDYIYKLKEALEWVAQFTNFVDVFNIGVASLAEMRENMEILSKHIPMDTGEAVSDL